MTTGFTLSLRATEPAPGLHTASLQGARPGRFSAVAASIDVLAQRESLLRRYGWLRGWMGTTNHLRESQRTLIDRMRNDLVRAISRVERASCPTLPCPGSRD